MTIRRSQQVLLAVTALVYFGALLLPAVAVPVPFARGISFAGWQATLVALQSLIAPFDYATDGLSRLLFGASFTSNLLFVAALVVAARAVVTDASRRPQWLSATWERALVAALLLNAYWFLNAQLTGDATSSHASRVTDSAAVAHGQIVIRLPALLRVGYYLWLLAFALLALVIHWCRRRIAGNTVGPEAKGAAPRVQPAA